MHWEISQMEIAVAILHDAHAPGKGRENRRVIFWLGIRYEKCECLDIMGLTAGLALILHLRLDSRDRILFHCKSPGTKYESCIERPFSTRKWSGYLLSIESYTNFMGGHEVVTTARLVDFSIHVRLWSLLGLFVIYTRRIRSRLHSLALRPISFLPSSFDRRSLTGFSVWYLCRYTVRLHRWLWTFSQTQFARRRRWWHCSPWEYCR